MAQSPFEIKKEICDVGKRIYDHGFVAANDGNISVKVGPNEFYCTPTAWARTPSGSPPPVSPRAI